MAITIPNIIFDGVYNKLFQVSPDNNIWEIQITNEGNPNIIDTATTYETGISPPVIPYSDVYYPPDIRQLLVSPNNKIWEIQVTDLGEASIIDTGETFDSGGLPIPNPPFNTTYATDYIKLIKVSPNLKMWEITISNSGVPVINDTGQTFTPSI